MTDSTTTTRVSYTGDGTSVNFTITFPFYLSTDILVQLAGATVTNGYSISGGSGSTGTLTMATPPAAGVNVQAILNPPLTQIVNLVDGTAFPSATLNQVNDRSVQIGLRLQDQINRSIRAPDGDSAPVMLLSNAANRKNKALMFDSNGNLTLGVPNTQVITTDLLASFLGLQQTAAEIAAGVTPINYAYPPGNVLRYGANTTPGTTDMTSAINNALASNLSVFIPAGTYLISSSLIYQDDQNISGAGYLNTTIKGDLSNASFFRSAYGEIPAAGNRPLGVTIANLCIFPKTAATITAGSVGINFRNAQYCSAVGLLMQYTDIGMVTDQNGQFLRFERVHAQVHNTALWSNAAIGGNNCISDCSLGGNVVALDLDGGAWDVSKTDCSAILAGTTYCVRLGRPGGATTVVHADKIYTEGLNVGTITMQIENSVNRSRVSLHRHSVLGTIVNNAGEACMIEVPGQGFYNPVYRAQRLEFASAVDGSALSGLRANGGNTLEARNAANTDFAYFYAMLMIAKQVTITYSASMTPDASTGQRQIITATNGTAFTISNPTNGLSVNQTLTITIRNASGGALGAVTWGANYKMSAWTQPANGFNRSIEFAFDGTSLWVQISQTGVDVPN